MLTEKFYEVLKNEGVVSIVTSGKDEPHVVNTWNSYLNVTSDERILIPVGGMRKTQENVEQNSKVKLTLGSKEVMGTYGPGTGFLVEGTARFLAAGPDFDMMKQKLSFIRGVLEITVKSAAQTL